MLQTIKNFGYVAALETLVTVAFFVTSFLCLYAEAYDGAAVAGVVSVIAAGIGLWHYQNEKLTGPNLVGISNESGPPVTDAEFKALVGIERPKKKTKTKAKPAKKKPTKRK